MTLSLNSQRALQTVAAHADKTSTSSSDGIIEVSLDNVLATPNLTRALVTVRTKLSASEAIGEIARQADGRTIEQLGRLLSDANFKQSASAVPAGILNLLKQIPFGNFQVESEAVIAELLKEPATCMRLIATERRVSGGSEEDEEDQAARSERPSQRIADFIGREILDSLVDQAIVKLRAARGMARLPCIVALGVERPELIAKLARHTDRVVLLDQRQRSVESKAQELSHCSFECGPLRWVDQASLETVPNVIVLGDGFLCAENISQATTWMVSQIAQGSTVVSAQQSPRPLSGSPAHVRRAVGDAEKHASLLTVESLLLRRGVHSTREEYTLRVAARTPREDELLQRIIVDSLSEDAQNNPKLIDHYLSLWYEGPRKFNYPIDLLITSNHSVVQPVDADRAPSVFKSELPAALEYLANYVRISPPELAEISRHVPKLESADLQLISTARGLTLDPSSPQDRVRLHAQILLWRWIRQSPSHNALFNLVANLATVHEWLPMIFREVVLWQGRLEDVRAKYRVPHTMAAALDEQLRTLLHPHNERGPMLQRECQGALEAEYLVREWLLTPPTRDSEELVPPPLRFINGQEVSEGLNDALYRARSYALLGEDAEAGGTGANSTEDPADDTHETDQEETDFAEDDAPLQVLLKSAIFVQEYEQRVIARAMKKNAEVRLLLAAREKNELISQDQLTIINSEWKPKGDSHSQPDYHKYRVLPLEEQELYQSKVISARETIKRLLLEIPELQKLALERLVTVLAGSGLGRYVNVPPRTLQRDYKERLQLLVPELLPQLARLQQAKGLDEAKNIASAGVNLFEKIDFQPRFYNELQALLSVAVHNPGSLEGAHKGRFESPELLGKVWSRIAATEADRQFYRNTLQEHNLRLVVSIARKYHRRNPSFSLDDLIHEGSLGLARAIDKFSLDAGAALATYATWWIEQCITLKIRESGKVIRLPDHLYETIAAIGKAQQRLQTDFGSYSRIPNERLAEEAGLSVDTVKRLLPFMSRTTSLNNPLWHDSDSTLESFLTSDSGQSNFKNVEKRFARHEMGRLLHLLEPRAQDIIILRAGLGMRRVLRKDGRVDFVESPRDVGVSLTLEAVGKVLAVTRERVRQIEGKAHKVLAKHGENALKATPDAHKHPGVIAESDLRLQLFTSQLSLEKRTVNVLQENGYLTVAQLLAVQPQFFGRLANLGDGTARKILTALEQIGFSWQGDHWLDTTIL